VEGAFAHIAAGRIFPEGNCVSYSDLKAAYNSVVTGECDAAVLPIENSYAGEVGQTLDLIFSGTLYINGIYELEIHQNLLGIADATVDDIKKVTSHPQALSQCHDYIEMRGFEAEEAEAVLDSGAIPISLGTRILRTESAAPFVLACLSFAFE
jgi:chorismate mutase/prephenate dehydratase